MMYDSNIHNSIIAILKMFTKKSTNLGRENLFRQVILLLPKLF